MFNTNSKSIEDENHWISVSDLMAGLMIIFMFISLVYLQRIHKETASYFDLRAQLHQDLEYEFKEDLARWNAEINPETLSVRFKEPDVLFSRGESELSDKFRAMLADFFPRYLAVLVREKYQTKIEEVRIEGHTSTEARPIDKTQTAAYLFNMKLSQDRSRAVARFVLHELEGHTEINWLRTHIRANGLSSSQVIYDQLKENENREASRRVEFRIKLKEKEILDSLGLNAQTEGAL